MNWDEIKEKYPKAYDKFGDWFMQSDTFEKGIEMILEKQIGVKDRDLYDFFDEQGVYIGIEILFYDAIFYYSPHIVSDNLDICDDLEGSESRTEAEEKAFIKAF